MAHVELSLSELSDGGRWTPGRAAFAGSLDRWASVVAVAGEPCLLLDAAVSVVAVSPGCAALFGIDADAAIGRPLTVGGIRFLDFNTAAARDLPDWDLDKIPPIRAMTSQGMARGLLRVPGVDGGTHTVDAISTPLRDGEGVVGSLTFFAPVGR